MLKSPMETQYQMESWWRKKARERERGGERERERDIDIACGH